MGIYVHYPTPPAPYLRKITLLPDRYPAHDHYPFNLRPFQETKTLTLDTPLTFFAGENGAGKSTLLKALARKCGIPMWGASEKRHFRQNPYEQRLHHYVVLDWAEDPPPGAFFGSDIFQNFAENLDEWATADPGLLKYFGGASLVAMSHGQSLMAYFRNRYCIKGLYLLDEPETALSPKTQLEFLRILAEQSRDGHAQFIVATHSPILLACPGAVIYSFDHAPIQPIAYQDTEHFQVFKAFMANPESFLPDPLG